MSKKKLDYASLYTLRKDGRYQGSYMENGKQHFVYDRDPERLWHKLHDPKEPVVYRFSQAASDWERFHSALIGYKTAEAYTAPLRRILDTFGQSPAIEITAAEISAFLDRLGKQGYARRTVQMHRDILNMIFNQAIVDGHMRFNPCTAAPMPRNLHTSKRELPTDAAIKAVQSGLDQPFGLFAYVCLYAGLRRGEALALEYADIDRDSGIIHVTKSVEFIGNAPRLKPPKTEAGNRDAILFDVLAGALPPDGEGLLFPGTDGKLMTKTQYRKRWARYCAAIGQDLTAHQLRHGFATILYEAGVPDKDAQELLGHSSIVVTRDIYTHIRQTRRDSTSRAVNDYLNNVADNVRSEDML